MIHTQTAIVTFRRKRFLWLAITFVNLLVAALLTLAPLNPVAVKASCTGGGNFAEASGSPIAWADQPFWFDTGDLNGDTKLDLAVTNSINNSITLLAGNGTGGFSPVSGSPFSASYPKIIQAGDFNGDGKLDIVFTSGTNSTGVMLGDGAGRFVSPAYFTVGNYPIGLTVADFNGDSKADLVIANSNSNNLSFLLGNGAGSFTSASNSPLPGGTFPNTVAAVNLNGDSRPDLIFTNAQSKTISVLLNQPFPSNLQLTALPRPTPVIRSR